LQAVRGCANGRELRLGARKKPKRAQLAATRAEVRDKYRFTISFRVNLFYGNLSRFDMNRHNIVFKNSDATVFNDYLFNSLVAVVSNSQGAWP
jgi:hypothetical protein